MLSITLSIGRPYVATISGDLDMATVPVLYKAFSGLMSDVVVDCAGIEFIDSAGFRAFDSVYASALNRGTSFQLIGLQGMARRVAEILVLPYADLAAY